ncbi:carbonic anhydrase 12 isoform X3 [Pseudophryne corroboree]|uniref:carbonic anhydrase 12 isoform X3 n=1 Tax=Pseudophryne corroboree TaxID=495146 RepID=UPI0030813DDC
MYRLLFCLLTLPTIQAASDGHSWAYSGNEGESNWPIKYSFCGGVYQSPLDFHRSILQYDSTLEPIRLYGYNASSTDSFTIINNGHTVSVNLLLSMYMEIPPFRYIASELHFHWGNLASPTGSEHCIGGKRFAAEIGSFNPTYDKIFSQLTNIKYKGQQTQIPGFNVQDLVPKSLDSYYRYEGSLTTPPCYPSVLWSVFRNPVFISEEQLSFLETALYCTEWNSSAPLEMTDNYRHLQKEGGRLVSVSFREGIVLTVVLASLLGVLVLTAVTCWFLRKRKRGKTTKAILYTAAVPMEENASKV